MTKHTITIIVEADETVIPLKMDEVRDSLARTLSQDYSVWHDQHGYEQVSALINKIHVDGRIWNEERSVLEGYPDGVTPEVIGHLMNGRKIQAIKLIRENTGYGLGEAKAIADNWKP